MYKKLYSLFGLNFRIFNNQFIKLYQRLLGYIFFIYIESNYYRQNKYDHFHARRISTCGTTHV